MILVVLIPESGRALQTLEVFSPLPRIRKVAARPRLEQGWRIQASGQINPSLATAGPNSMNPFAGRCFTLAEACRLLAGSDRHALSGRISALRGKVTPLMEPEVVQLFAE